MSTPALQPPQVVQDIAAACRRAGGRAWLVGGCVRDHLLGRPLKDWDVEVHGLDADTLERTLRTVGKVDTVGKAFSVFKLRRGSHEIDVSLPRRDSKHGPGHRGIRAEGDPHLGLVEATRRRDLTINAIMVDLHDGTIADPWHGVDDLRAGILRAVDATTFLEDPLRALRVVQFAARFGFTVSPELLALCREAALDELPAERVQGEWVKLLKATRPGHGLRVAREADLLRRVFPEAHDDPALDDLLDRAAGARWPDEPRHLTWMLLVWLHRTDPPTKGLWADGRTVRARTPPAPPGVVATLDRLGLHTTGGYRLRERLCEAHAASRERARTVADLRWLATRCEPAFVLRLQALQGDPTAEPALSSAEALGIERDAPPRWVQGRDLVALGVPPGPAMGEVLDEVYAHQLDGALDGPEAARAWVRAWVEARPR